MNTVELRREYLGRVLAAHGPWCFYCKRALFSTGATIDHVLPSVAGGSDALSNLVPACRSCNSSKRRNRAPRPNRRGAGCHCPMPRVLAWVPVNGWPCAHGYTPRGEACPYCGALIP